ncbi:MAG: DUF488 domain-containing protein [Anaerovibrio sp.]|nr:DUF488 domain-containing protein [Anaerovibrio sp.]
MGKIFTIGFTKKTAEKFFLLLERNNVDVVIDVRLNNTSQLAGFSKYPDIEFFLKRLVGTDYIHDEKLSPTSQILSDYKKRMISWDEYVKQFNELMHRRDIKSYIYDKYMFLKDDRVCLLCSEEKPQCCHRSLVAEIFQKVFDGEIIHL